MFSVVFPGQGSQSVGLGGDLYNRDFEKRVRAWISNPSSLKGSGVVIKMLQASKFHEAKTTRGSFYRLQRSCHTLCTTNQTCLMHRKLASQSHVYDKELTTLRSLMFYLKV